MPCRLLFERADGQLSAVVLSLEARTIGRAAPADIVVDDPTISKLHARCEFRGGAVSVFDLGSKNGVWFEGKRVDTAVVKPGQSVKLGSLTMWVVVSLAQATLADDGLVDREALLARLDAELERANAYHRPLGLAIVDDLPARVWAPQPGWVMARVEGQLWVVAPEAGPAFSKQLVGHRGGVVVEAGPELEAPRLVAAVREAARRAGPNQVLTASLVRREALASLEDREDERTLKAARSPLPILILGETGVGKEVMARRLHHRSGRTGPFCAVNCGALTDTLLESTLFGHVKGAFTGAVANRRGLFEEASGGTVFLDEVGDLSPSAQAALLRTLETSTVVRVGQSRETPVDARVISATNRDLEAMAADGAFRLDLLHRLNSVTLRLEPLRRRPQVLLELARRFVSEACETLQVPVIHLDRATTARLLEYAWPGNIRELKNVIQRAVVLSDGKALDLEDLPVPGATRPSASAPLRTALDEVERKMLLEAIERANGNQAAAAALLGLPRRTLNRKLMQHGIRKHYRLAGE